MSRTRGLLLSLPAAFLTTAVPNGETTADLYGLHRDGTEQAGKIVRSVMG